MNIFILHFLTHFPLDNGLQHESDKKEEHDTFNPFNLFKKKGCRFMNAFELCKTLFQTWLVLTKGSTK